MRAIYADTRAENAELRARKVAELTDSTTRRVRLINRQKCASPARAASCAGASGGDSSPRDHWPISGGSKVSASTRLPLSPAAYCRSRALTRQPVPGRTYIPARVSHGRARRPQRSFEVYPLYQLVYILYLPTAGFCVYTRNTYESAALFPKLRDSL